MARTAKLLYLLPLFLLHWNVSGAIVSSVNDLPGLAYDFVVVGGGTAGNVVANRLSENPHVSVLVLEAGGLPDDDLNVSVPFFCTRATPDTAVDWNFTTVSMPGLNGRSIPYPRGHTLGGSSSVNYMAYTRGTSEDYDRYARFSGDPGWSWDSLQKYFRKNEIFTAPADHHNITGQFDPAVHGFNGINSVSLFGFPQPIDGRVIETTKQLPEFPFRLDYNSGNHLGIGFFQFTIKNGSRSSSRTSYLGEPFVSRKNLHVLVNAQVSKLLSTESHGGQPHFQAVEFRTRAGGPLQKVQARKEIILSAGSVGTPNILLHSGVGNSELFKQLGIKTVLHNPSVGRNLSDHPLVPNVWTVNSNDTFEKFTENPAVSEADLELWQNNKTGVFANSIANNVGWIRFPNDSSILSNQEDPAAGPNTAHFELLISNGRSIPPFPTAGNFLSITTVLLTPTSRGHVTINSSDPFAAPLIDPNMLSTEFDVAGLIESIRSVRRFVSAPAWDGYIATSVTNATTDADLEAFVRSTTSTLFHPVGTAAMTPKNAGYGVVDPDLRVKGVDGLRIVDASVLPLLPAAHTQAAVYVFAERASDLIKVFWKI